MLSFRNGTGYPFNNPVLTSQETLRAQASGRTELRAYRLPHTRVLVGWAHPSVGLAFARIESIGRRGCTRLHMHPGAVHLPR